jgi:hypothetical protein
VVTNNSTRRCSGLGFSSSAAIDINFSAVAHDNLGQWPAICYEYDPFRSGQVHNTRRSRKLPSRRARRVRVTGIATCITTVMQSKGIFSLRCGAWQRMHARLSQRLRKLKKGFGGNRILFVVEESKTQHKKSDVATCPYVFFACVLDGSSHSPQWGLFRNFQPLVLAPAHEPSTGALGVQNECKQAAQTVRKACATFWIFMDCSMAAAVESTRMKRGAAKAVSHRLSVSNGTFHNADERRAVCPKVCIEGAKACRVTEDGWVKTG